MEAIYLEAKETMNSTTECGVAYIQSIDLSPAIIDMFLADYCAEKIGIEKQIIGLETRYRALCKIIKRLEDARNTTENQ
jgi:hypothetical protein